MRTKKQFEIYPGIFVTNNCDIDYVNGKRLDVSKFKQFSRSYNGQTFPEQAVRSKIAKNHGWGVCKSWSEPQNKKMCFEVMVNANKTEIKTVSYEEICQEYRWKSFIWSKDNQTLIPKI